MNRIFDIAFKDILQLVRDRNIFLFLLIIPVVFTLLFGFAFGGFSKAKSDIRLPVGYLDQDQTWLSGELHNQLAASEVVRLVEAIGVTRSELETAVAEEEIAAAIILPAGYAAALLDGGRSRITLIADPGSTSGTSIESDLLSASLRVESAVNAALIMERVVGKHTPFDYVFETVLNSWQEPPIRVVETTSSAINSQDVNAGLAHTSPGMMIQFGIAGLLTCARMMVVERKTRCLQRMLTTSIARLHILTGHFLAILAMILGQMVLLIVFGQLALGLNYLAQPAAILLVATAAAFCIAGLGLLIGTLARTEEMAIVISIMTMFVLSGMGGAMAPLEVTGPTFQAIGHLSPVAWAMDGYKNVLIRGQGLESALLPAAMLFGYGVLFFILSTWRFRTE